MPKQLSGEALLRELYKNDLKPSGAGELHRRQTIGIAGNQDNPVHGPVGSIGGDVETDPHVDSLLLESGFEIVDR